MDRSRALSRLAAGGVVTVLALGFAGCSPSTYSLRAGDCFTASADMLTGTTEISDIDTTSCTRSHNSEVVGTDTLTDATFPGTEALVARAQQVCPEKFEDYVGIAYTESAYDLYPLIPTEKTWEVAGARTITCVALTLPATRESLKGAGEAAAHT